MRSTQGTSHPCLLAGFTFTDILFRGTEKTLTFSCFDTPTERQINGLKHPLVPVDAYEEALAETYAGSQATSNICRAKYEGNHSPEFIGTAFVARDLMSVVDALGEDGLLRLWGESSYSLCSVRPVN